MKKFTFIALAITAVLGVNSCTEKEGVYSPKMKIDKIYDLYNGQQNLVIVFNWDGDKLVSISDGGENVSTLTYDDMNRIATYCEDGMVFNYTYDGDLLSRISYTGDHRSYTMDFTHDGKKITKMTVTITDDYYPEDKGMNFNFASHALGLLLPPQICKEIDAVGHKVVQQAKGTKGETHSFDILFTWRGKNIIRMDDPSWSESHTYEYDNKPSPFNNMILGSSMLWGNTSEALSSNNITRIVTTFSNHETKGSITTTYTYEYGEKNYPTKIISNNDTTIITYL